MFVNEKTNCRIYSFCHPFMTPQRTPLCIPFSGVILFTKREEATLIKILVTHVYHHKNSLKNDQGEDKNVVEL